jgi:nucleoside-diphosphate-sugar epimerase
MRVFVAGARGALGSRLVPELIAAGHEVTGTHRSPGNADTRSGANGVLEFRPFGLPAEWGRGMSAARSIPAGSAAPDQIASRR